MLWKQDLEVDLLSYNSNLIDVKVTTAEGGMDLRFSGFYGFLNVAERDRSWQLLKDLHGENDMCWIVGGGILMKSYIRRKRREAYLELNSK